SNVYDSSADPLNNHYVWYKAETDDGAIGYISSIEMTQLGERLSGKDRYKTAVAISQKGWNHADTVVLARGGEFPDALAGTPLAYQHDAPMLLTEDNKLTDSTKKELERLEPNKVIILGSSGAITDKVSNEIKAMGIE
ncbi:cell wall-binding repeat-containing protein, partial [Pantoea sp. SIMBA_133]